MIKLRALLLKGKKDHVISSEMTKILKKWVGEIPVLGIYLRAMQTCVYKKTKRMFIGVLIIIAKNRPNVHQQMSWAIHPMNCYSAIKEQNC